MFINSLTVMYMIALAMGSLKVVTVKSANDQIMHWCKKAFKSGGAREAYRIDMYGKKLIPMEKL